MQKIPKLVQRIRLGRNLPGPSRPLFGASFATLDPPISFLDAPVKPARLLKPGGTGVSMNKELFVSSTPHETKVGLVEDDLLAEIYLERENEYTLAGSIYKGRVTRVLPGMQSAFVDIGLERDAFLYVSDFMELEEHDEDLTDIVPANRGVQDLRAAMVESAPGEARCHGCGRLGFELLEAPSRDSVKRKQAEGQSRLRLRQSIRQWVFSRPRTGSYRGRRRRRGGRRDGRSDGRGAKAAVKDVIAAERAYRARNRAPPPSSCSPAPRLQESGRSQQFGPPAGYQPILLPGESISKYRGMAQPPAAPEQRVLISLGS